MRNANIRGFQECSLLDWDGRICCTIFLEGCNFRCLFCHNPELVEFSEKDSEKESRILEEKILEYLTSNIDFIDGVCITGGEPTISNIRPLLEKIKNIGYRIKLDTNGSNPKTLELLVTNNLIDYIAMDIKSPKDKYAQIVGNNVNIESIQSSVEFIKNSKIEYEFRTTFIPIFMNENDILQIAHWLGNVDSWIIQRFQPKNAFDIKFRTLPIPTDEDMRHILDIAKKIIHNTKLRG